MQNASIYLITNDQRLHDNPVLTQAIAASEAVVPVYVMDTEMLSKVQYHSQKMGRERYHFLLQSLYQLKANLLRAGADLWYFEGPVVSSISALAAETGIRRIYVQEEPGMEEKKTVQGLRNSGLEVIEVKAACLVPKERLPYKISQLPLIFTAFRTKIEKHIEIEKPLPTVTAVKTPTHLKAAANLPSLPELAIDKRSAFPFSGGENAALERLHYYFFETQKVFHYKETRNGLVGIDYSSKFSPWLALGNVSVRTIFEQLLQLEKAKNTLFPKETSRHPVRENFSSESTYWIVFELLWREFFRLNAYKYGVGLFKKEGFLFVNKSYKNDTKALERWKNGETGDDFVDANMRELKATGFMSNRGRQNVASYLVHDMGLDWRWGAAWFEEKLLDYDPYSNWGNWQYIAGVGNDPRFRKFNTQVQADRYDAKGQYRNSWMKHS